jgi:hypothetical protein
MREMKKKEERDCFSRIEKFDSIITNFIFYSASTLSSILFSNFSFFSAMNHSSFLYSLSLNKKHALIHTVFGRISKIVSNGKLVSPHEGARLPLPVLLP